MHSVYHVFQEHTCFLYHMNGVISQVNFKILSVVVGDISVIGPLSLKDTLVFVLIR